MAALGAISGTNGLSFPIESAIISDCMKDDNGSVVISFVH